MATGIRWPLGFPPPLRDGYGWEPQQSSRTNPFQPEHGMSRVRRKTTREDRLVDVKWFIKGGAQFSAFVSWWQNDLLAGERDFDVELEQDDGQGVIWYTCKWLDEYAAEATPEGDWFISGKLLTLGSGFATRELGSLRGRAVIEITALATLVIVVALRGSATVEVFARGKLKPRPLRGRAVSEVFARGMLAEVHEHVLTEDGAFSMVSEDEESMSTE